MDDRRGSLGGQRGQPGVLGADHSVGGQDRQGAAAGALPEQDAQRGRREHDQVGEGPGDLAGQPALLGLLGQCRALGVDDRHQGQVEVGGQPDATTRHPQPTRSERLLECLAVSILTQDDARRPTEAGQRQQHSGVVLALSGPTQQQDVGRAEFEQGLHARSVGATGQQDGVPRARGRFETGIRVRHARLGAGDRRLVGMPRVQHRERPRRHLGEPLDRHHRVDDAAGVEVLGDLDAVGERPSVERLVDAGAEEPDHCARLGDRDVAQRPPRRQHPTGRRVAQIDDVGQPGGLELGDRGRDLDHAEEGRRAFLHPRAPRGRSGEEGQLLVSSAFKGQRDPLGGSLADRPGEEAELTGDTGHTSAPDAPFAGEDRLVGAGGLGRGGEVGGILAAGLSNGGRRSVPTDPTALVENSAQQLPCPDAPRCAHGRAFRREGVASRRGAASPR